MTFDEWISSQKSNLIKTNRKSCFIYPWSSDKGWGRVYAQKCFNQADSDNKMLLSFAELLKLAWEAGLTDPSQVGKSRGKYQLARIDDSGHYELGNCRYVTMEENQSERRISDDGYKSLSEKNSGEGNGMFKGYWITPKGLFTSLVSAAVDNLCSKRTVKNRCESKRAIFSDWKFVATEELRNEIMEWYDDQTHCGRFVKLLTIKQNSIQFSFDRMCITVGELREFGYDPELYSNGLPLTDDREISANAEWLIKSDIKLPRSIYEYKFEPISWHCIRDIFTEYEGVKIG